MTFDVKRRCEVSVLSIILVCVLLSLVVVVVVFVILPNSPTTETKHSDEKRESAKLLPFALGIVSVVALSFLVICVVVVVYMFCRKVLEEYTVTDPITTVSQVTYRTDHNNQQNRSNQRKGIFEPYQNFGFEEDEIFSNHKSDRASSKKTFSQLHGGPRSSFAEDLYNTFKSIQLSQTARISTSPKKGRSFFDSVDDEGYHFDIVEDYKSLDGSVHNLEEEIVLDSSTKPPLRRLDTFDLTILETLNKLKKGPLESTERDADEEPPSKPPRLRNLPTQESFTGLDKLKSFDKYLSLVRLDSIPNFDEDNFPVEVDKDNNLPVEDEDIFLVRKDFIDKLPVKDDDKGSLPVEDVDNLFVVENPELFLEDQDTLPTVDNDNLFIERENYGEDNLPIEEEDINESEDNLPFEIEDINEGEDNLPIEKEDINKSEDNLPIEKEVINKSEDNLPFEIEDINEVEDNLPIEKEDINKSEDNLPIEKEDINKSEDNLPIEKEDINESEDNLPIEKEDIIESKDNSNDLKKN